MKKELLKYIKNYRFIVMCILGIVIAFIHCYQAVLDYNEYVENFNNINSNILVNPYAETVSIYKLWIGGNENSNISKYFFNILPFVVVSVCCWFIFTKTNNKHSYEYDGTNKAVNKYIALFITLGIIISVPLITDFFTLLLFIPIEKTDSVYDIYYGIFSNSFMANIFYKFPVIYIAIFVIINFCFSGLLGCLSYSLYLSFKNKILTILFPVFIVYSIDIYQKHLSEKKESSFIDFSPLSYLYPIKSINTTWYVVVSELLFLFICIILFSIPQHIKRKQ